MRIVTPLALFCALAFAAAPALAKPNARTTPPASCTGTFSNGASINVSARGIHR